MSALPSFSLAAGSLLAARARIRRHPRWRWFALVVLAMGMMLSVINVSIVNVALPAIASEFGTDVSSVGWVVTGFLLTQATLLLLAGRAGDLYGRRRVFVAGVVVVIVGSVLCALSWSAASLIAFRIVQGIGACAMAPAAIGGVVQIFGSAERGKAMGVLAGVIGIAPVLGLNLAGLLMNAFGWRSVFWFSPLLGVVVLAGAALVLPHSQPLARGESFDIVGAVLVAFGLFATLLAVSRGEIWGWWSAPTLISAGVGALALVAFVAHETRTREPMLALGLFRLRSLASANAVSFLSAAALFGALILLPFYLTDVLGYGPQRLALAITPVAASFVVVAPVAGRLVPRFGPSRIAGVGLLLGAAGALLMAIGAPSERFAGIVPGMVALACGLAMAIAPINTTAVHDVPGYRLGVASSLPNITRYTGGAIGSAATLAVLHAYIGDVSTGAPSAETARATVEGVRHALVIAVVALLLAAAVSLAMPRRLLTPIAATAA